MKRRNKHIGLLLAVALLVGCIPVPKVHAASVPKTYAHAYYVMNGTTGSAIVAKYATKKIYPASTTKLLTALVALEHSDEDKQIKYTKRMKKTVAYDASRINLSTGRVYTTRQYLTMLLLRSDADSAAALVYGIAGSQSLFVKWMNQKAKALGMNRSHFDNAVGLDKGSGYPKTYTTAKDFSKAAFAAMQNKTIQSIVKLHKYRVKPIGVKSSFVIKNTNAFYGVYANLVKKADYTVIGSKTGTTRAAGNCLIATAIDSKGNKVIVCFFGNGGYERLYKDVKKLFDYAFSKF